MNIKHISSNGIAIINSDGSIAYTLTGGNVQIIRETFNSLMTYSEPRAKDYLAGVVAGLTHCAITQEVPKIGLLNE